MLYVYIIFQKLFFMIVLLTVHIYIRKNALQTIHNSVDEGDLHFC